ncbi:aminoacyl-tRNA hydrolase [Leifsonia sp. Root112D2]|jgi:PTH1 family peptidyl-tRNA hydrolase|uniref:aminoacyl-tRNA hydrolase n=1 Tax=Leifsonia sp. Root112D2 TaxID=1736426 RepID=UPI0006FEEC1A|nr:aminoacyl-tRNA hydrolase [Leifsonia sp. Root112D2]KQV07468.1 peptidyl-tRNA hydrolase [Leifsonia sp. Root112D2]
MDDSLWLVVGLGNPGPGYAGNRHNVGAMVVSQLAARASATFKRHKTNAQVAEGRLVAGGTRFVFAKPLSFMNLSGGPVSQLLRFYSLDASRLIVVHDELDIPFDTVKLKVGGGHGGHNGIRDIASAIGTPEFARVRVGIGRPPGRQDAADFVLRDFSGTERQALPSLISDAADAAEQIATDGLTAAQLRFHTPRA